MSKTVVGLFNTLTEAEKVKAELISEGYTASQIKVVANDNSGSTASVGNTDKGYTDIGSGGGTGVGEKISSFFSNLTGGDEHAHNHYATGVNSGGALLTATVNDNEASEIAEALQAHGARDIEGGYQDPASSEMSAYDRNSQRAGTSTSGDTAIPVIEEELVVGKREVNRGGVRIYSHLVERPVEEDVTLRDEQINVERHAVNRPATAADFAAGQDGVIEMKAMGEEAVVGKTSRVVEEVHVGKTSSERTEAIHDTVRKTEVDVENLTGAAKQNDRY